MCAGSKGSEEAPICCCSVLRGSVGEMCDKTTSKEASNKQGNLCFLVAHGDLVLQSLLYGEFAFVLALGESE